MDKRYFLLGGIVLAIMGLLIYKFFNITPPVPKQHKSKEEIRYEQEKEAKITKEGLPVTNREENEGIVLAFAQTLYFASYYKSNYELVQTNVDNVLYPEDIKSKDNAEKGKYIVNLITNGNSVTNVTTTRSHYDDDSWKFELKIDYYDKSSIDHCEIELKDKKIVSIKMLQNNQ